MKIFDIANLQWKLHTMTGYKYSSSENEIYTQIDYVLGIKRNLYKFKTLKVFRVHYLAIVEVGRNQ